jgi:hypothetical protein
MKQVRVRLILFLCLVSTAFHPTTVLAHGDDSAPEAVKLLTPGKFDLLHTRAGRFGTSANPADTTWVGYTSGHTADNYWSIYSGSGADGFRQGSAAKGVWNWEQTVHGDSLQGWWPLLNLYDSTGGLILPDDTRPWWGLDFGNMANYRINEANGRTFGVVGVWHRDAGNLAGAAGPFLRPRWRPPSGSFAAWMGLRAHGDATYLDPETGNAFNEDVMMYSKNNSSSSSGNDEGFPGYGSQMDQMLYRDIDLTGNVQSTCGSGGPCFSPKTDFTTSTGPSSVAIGDLNGDGKSDLVVTNRNANSVSVLLGNGNGTFGPKSDFPTGTNPTCVVILDLNGDGKPDIAVVNFGASTVSILLGTGSGTFGPKSDFATGSTPVWLAAADLNGDGKTDLAVSTAGSGTISVLLGHGDGTFGPTSEFAGGASRYTVAIGDLNGDGKPDLATTNYFGNSVSVALGNGDGTFGAVSDFAVGTNPFSVAIGDLNGDGKPDLAVANSGATTVSVLLGNGNGTFGLSTAYTTGGSPNSIAVRDVDGDGIRDIVTTEESPSPAASALFGNGDGTFRAHVDLAAGGGASSVAVGDLNGDAKPDIAVGNRVDNTVSVLLNQTTSAATLTIRFKFKTVMSTGIVTTASTRTGWFDRDPLGLVSGNYISSSAAGSAAPCDSFMFYIGSGVGNGLDGNQWLGSDGVLHSVYDPRRRWFGEVLNQESQYRRELLSVAGNWPADTALTTNGFVDTTFVISSTVLAPMLADSNRIRLVFRVKTNRTFDDQDGTYSSGQKGAAVLDRVSYQIGSNPEVVFGDFENAGDINNDPAVGALAAWKSTGKPPGIFHHVHALSSLPYQDPCGMPGDPARSCNLSGVVISAGDHDHGEAAGGLATDPYAQHERADGIMSPTIQFVGPYNGPGGTNACGLKAAGTGAGDIQASGDYFIAYDIFPGIMDQYTQGNFWRYGVMSYPSNSKFANGSYPAWGQMRFSPFTIFDPDPICFSDLEPLNQDHLVRTSNSNGIPDSIRIFIGKIQECFRFGLSTGCSPTDGCYFDNVSLGIVDTPPGAAPGTPPLSVQIYNWFSDTFPANETAGLPGTSAFDTTSGYVKTGQNIAQMTANTLRFDIPGDSVVVASKDSIARVDLVFRILPGPGNYQIAAGRSCVPGEEPIGILLQVPTNQAGVASSGDASFWGQYMANAGDVSAGNHHGHTRWDPNTWNSARCDTAEKNIFPVQSQGNLSGLTPGIWMSTYHESDPHFNTLGYSKFKCFVIDTTKEASSSPTLNNVSCNGVVPAWLTTVPQSRTGYNGSSVTKEYTKIIPDGLLTPGSHVEYFLRAQTSTAPGAASAMLPDTNLVLQPDEGSTDGHRWQEFSVLPNRWKSAAFGGRGPACMLVIDAADRRGSERVWVGVADSIGATPQSCWGAHNGWHAVPGGDIDNPADNRRADGSVGFTSKHVGQAGNGGTWDMYQIKGAETGPTAAGTLGSRLANRASMGFAANKYSVQGPTPEMLRAYYQIVLYLSGDLSVNILGPFANHGQNEVALLQDFLTASGGTANRGFWAMGDGFARANIAAGGSQSNFMQNYLGCNLVSTSYRAFSGDSRSLVGLRFRSPGSAPYDSIGVRNACPTGGQSNDVLTATPSLAEALVVSEYFGGPAGTFAAGVYKDYTPSRPWRSLVNGWDIENLTARHDDNTVWRSIYFYKMFAGAWAQICTIDGTPLLDVPNAPNASVLHDFFNLWNNPLARGQALIRLGLARPDYVEVRLYDVSGRLVRTLADRFFTAGVHEIAWDGLDNAGRLAPHGLYFTKAIYRSGFAASRKVTLLR